MTDSSGSQTPRGRFSSRSGLRARPYSVSALQNYAYCPYRFFLSAMYHLQPLEDPEPLERMDPLTKGSLFHEVLAEFFRALQQRQMVDGDRDHGWGARDSRRHPDESRGKLR